MRQTAQGAFDPVSPEVSEEVIESVITLSKDLQKAATEMTEKQARFLVDNYYVMQKARMRYANQLKAMQEEPHGILLWLLEQQKTLERVLKASLHRFAKKGPVGQWLLSIDGIGPVIAAGLLAYIDIDKSPTVGSIYSYAGLNSERKWHGKTKTAEFMREAKNIGDDWRALFYLSSVYSMRPFAILVKGEHTAAEPPVEFAINFAAEHGRSDRHKAEFHADNVLMQAFDSHELRDIYPQFVEQIGMKLDWPLNYDKLQSEMAKMPWNDKLKNICWKAGESLAKVCNKEGAIYGQLYKERRTLEWEKNLNGEYADQAAQALTEREYRRDSVAYAFYSGKASVSYVRYMMENELPIPPSYRGSKQATDCVPMLPPAHIYNRAKRWAVKIMLSNVHEVMHVVRYGKPAPTPYPLAHLGHVDRINPAGFKIGDWVR